MADAVGDTLSLKTTEALLGIETFTNKSTQPWFFSLKTTEALLGIETPQT